METSDLLSCVTSTVCCRRTVRSLADSLLQRRTMMMLLIGVCILTRHEVYGVISITSPAQSEVTVSLGQTLSIQCVSDEGTPVKWSYGGQILEDEDAIRTHTIIRDSIDTSGRLISTLTLRDINEEGKYICSNPDDFYDRAEVDVKVYASAPPQTVQIVEPDGDELRTPTGEQFTLRCVGEEGSSVRWLHNGNPIRSMGTRVVITTSLDVDDHKIKSLLTRLNATPQEAGHYTCQDENQPRSSDTVRVTLYGAREDSIPVELVQPRSSQLAVDLDASFTLTCRGDTRASLTWYINNTLISLLNAPVQITMREADGPAKMTMLSVERAAYSDSGLYTCRNSKDLNDKDGVTVRVRHPDDVIEEPDIAPTELRREILRVGSPMKLSCSLEALADHVTEWYKDDRKLASDGNKYVIKNTGAAELYIQNTDWMDAGVYRCTFLYRDTGVVIANILFNLTTIPCRPLTPPQNGSFVTCPEDPLYGDFCTFRCHKGYRLTDKRPVICETPDGSGAYVWNRATPKCIGGELYHSLRDVSNQATHVTFASLWELAIHLMLVILVMP